MIQFASLTLPVSQRNAQAVGSAITYARRYALAAICGIAPDDDDGQTATNHAGATQKLQDTTNGTSASKQAAPVITPHSAPPVQPSEEPVDLWGDTPVPWFAAAHAALAPPIRQQADEWLTLHRNNGGPCSPKQYGYLAGLLDSVIEQATGVEKTVGPGPHRRVLTVLCQMDVTGDNRPSSTLAGRLLARLATHKRDDAGNKVVNPDYDQATADAMVVIYRSAENVGKPALSNA